jgi:CheY-like chemotaxis protein
MKTCVIGEADPFIARLLKRFAAESGLQTVVVRVGQDVLELARQVKPVVVIVEAELPGTVRGWEAVRALRADREICNIPVITCSWLLEANVDALVGEVAGHLQKPELLYEDFAAALREAGVEILDEDLLPRWQAEDEVH